MKIIFLDVDGVLNYSGCKERTPQGYYFVEEDRLLLLKEIIDKTRAEVVLSSSWRKGYYDYKSDLDTDDAKDFFLLKDKLLEFGIEIIGYTPMFETPYRGREIEYWLENDAKDFDIESILILDDDKDMKPLSDFLVRTSFFKGLTEKDVKKSIDILNGNGYKLFLENKQFTAEESSVDDVVVHGRVHG